MCPSIFCAASLPSGLMDTTVQGHWQFLLPLLCVCLWLGTQEWKGLFSNALFPIVFWQQFMASDGQVLLGVVLLAAMTGVLQSVVG